MTYAGEGPRCTCGRIMRVAAVFCGKVPHIEYDCPNDPKVSFFNGCGRRVKLDYQGWTVLIPPRYPKSGQREKHLQGKLP